MSAAGKKTSESGRLVQCAMSTRSGRVYLTRANERKNTREPRIRTRAFCGNGSFRFSFKLALRLLHTWRGWRELDAGALEQLLDLVVETALLRDGLQTQDTSRFVSRGSLASRYVSCKTTIDQCSGRPLTRVRLISIWSSRPRLVSTLNIQYGIPSLDLVVATLGVAKSRC